MVLDTHHSGMEVPIEYVYTYKAGLRGLGDSPRANRQHDQDRQHHRGQSDQLEMAQLHVDPSELPRFTIAFYG